MSSDLSPEPAVCGIGASEIHSLAGLGAAMLVEACAV